VTCCILPLLLRIDSGGFDKEEAFVNSFADVVGFPHSFPAKCALCHNLAALTGVPAKLSQLLFGVVFIAPKPHSSGAICPEVYKQKPARPYWAEQAQ